jgi:hypothetical protein
MSNVGIIVKVGLGKMWKEAAVAYFKNGPSISLEENHKETTHNPLG